MDKESVVSQVQRQIELQSPEDLTYLISNVRAAAASRLNEAFPHVDGQSGGSDDLRDQIERLVNEYIEQTFTLASSNLTINGMPVPSTSIASPATAEPAYEPFDTHKRRRLAEMTTLEEKLLEEVAALKRSVPAVAAQNQAAALSDSLKRDDDALAARVEALGDEAKGEKLEDDVRGLERQEGMEDGFADAIAGLGRLKKEMPSLVAKMERARVAGEYVVNGSRS